jgi:hypothetical protein
MRSTRLIMVALLASTPSIAQESVPPDSAHVGALLYRAHTVLTYPLEYGRKSEDVLGDLTTTISITNTGLTRITSSLGKCPVEVKAYINGEFRESPRITGFPSAIGCMTKAQMVSLAPGEARELSLGTRKWKHGFNKAFLGPLYFVAKVQAEDTVIDLRAGASALTSDLTDVEYHATSAVEGIAPASVVTRIKAFNHGLLPVHLLYGDCPVGLAAFPSKLKTKQIRWWSARSAPPWIKKTDDGVQCTAIAYTFHLAPGHEKEFTYTVPTYEIIADSLPEGRYSFIASLELNRKKITVDAGSTTIVRKQKPIPAERTVDNIRFASTVRRIHSLESTSDSLEFTITIKNSSTTPRHVGPYSELDCGGIRGYATPEARDHYYMHPAYDDGGRYLMKCPFTIPAMTLAPGESRSVVSRSAAPTSRLYYLVYMDVWDDNPARREPISVEISADEATPSR